MQAYRRGLIPQLGEEGGGACAVGKRAERAQCVFRPARQPGNHVIGIDSNTFQLCDELPNYFRVRHPAPDLDAEYGSGCSAC